MPIEFNCHLCGRLLRTSDDKAGRTAKCPGCGEAIAVPSPVEDDASEPFVEHVHDTPVDPHDNDSVDEIPVPAPQPADDTKVCPLCGETIKRAALRCRFCGEDVGDRPYATRRGRVPQGVDFGEVFSTSWKLFSDDMGPHILASLIVTFSGLIVLGFGALLGVVATVAVADGARDPTMAIVVAIVAGIVVLSAMVLVNAYVSTGYNIFLLKAVRGEQPEISDLFSGGPYFFRMLINSLVIGVLISIGYLFCIVPGILVALMLWPAGFVLVDENRPGLESLYRAKELMEGNWGSVFLLLLVASLIYTGAASICAIAGFFILPWMMVMMATTYCRLTGQKTIEG